VLILLSTGARAVEIDELVKQLELEPHMEGGYFRRTFQADHRDKIETAHGPRYTMTSIYYLLTADSPVGHWHRNRSDILHFFHLGAPITYYLIHPDGSLETVVLGPDPGQGHLLQFAVAGGVWKASQLGEGEYGLISEAVSPGFGYEDMSLGDRDALSGQFPQHLELIEAFSLK
jgi:predicted cupin superfamily sugar epimerase